MTQTLSLCAPADSLTYFINPQTTPAEISIYALVRVVGGNTISTTAISAFTQTGIAAGSTQTRTRIEPTQTVHSTQYVISTPINVNITEYGAIGEFRGRYFTGQVTIAGTTNTANVTCNFQGSEGLNNLVHCLTRIAALITGPLFYAKSS